MIWKNYFDVVILPPPPVQEYAIRLSRRLARYGGEFRLEKRRYIPHLSLYHIAVQPKDFDAFREEVRKIAAAFEPHELRLKNIESRLLMTEKPKWLTKLHRDVVAKTSRYFDWTSGRQDSIGVGWLPPKLQPRAAAYAQKYGSPLIGAAFRPHITLTSFGDKTAPAGIPPLPFEPMSFVVDRLNICELGPSHSCQRIVGRFPVGRL
jgi:2'-5' RNA ligase